MGVAAVASIGAAVLRVLQDYWPVLWVTKSIPFGGVMLATKEEELCACDTCPFEHLQP